MQDSQFSRSARFTPAHRLLRKNGFDHVVRSRSISDGRFKIFFARNEIKNARLGIIAGKKNLLLATDRNHVKRIVREAFRRHSIKWCSLDLVVMVRQAGLREEDRQTDKLKMLFSRVENRCAES